MYVLFRVIMCISPHSCLLFHYPVKHDALPCRLWTLTIYDVFNLQYYPSFKAKKMFSKNSRLEKKKNEHIALLLDTGTL